MGQFALFTYVRPFLETVAHVNVSTLSLILLGIGVAGFIGTVIIGTFLKCGLYRTLIAIPVVMAAIALALMPFGGRVGPFAALLGMWGLLGTAAPVGWWTWIAETIPQDAEPGGGLMVAVIQSLWGPPSAACCTTAVATKAPSWRAPPCCFSGPS